MRSTTVQDALQVALVLGCGAALLAAGRVLGRDEDAAPVRGLDQVLGQGLSLLGITIVTVWLSCLTLALVGAVLHRSGRPNAARAAMRLSPAVMRRLAATLIGVNLLAVPAVAQAAPDGSGYGQVVTQYKNSADSSQDAPRSPQVPAETSHTSTGSPYWSVESAPGSRPTALDRPGWKPSSIPADGGLLLRQDTRSAGGPVEVVVAPGDSLWSIVAAQLGPLADSAEVAEAWPAWFEMNRATIGDDPSLLIPGQVLRAPQA